MTDRRSNVLVEGEGIYHCMARCVRRAYLYGTDPITGKSYNYRKQWVRNRLINLTQIFTIDVLAYAVQDNHNHTGLRTRPDILRMLSEDEIARRWLSLHCPKKKRIPGTNTPTEEAVADLVSDKERLSTIRERLCSVSWFMKSLNEHLARMANKEDGCKGRFWEGRFKCVRLADQAALLACAVYIDLNPIRAAVAKTPETSTFTSAYERIQSLKNNPNPDSEPSLWIAPIHDTENRRGFLSITLPEYLSILDITGREIQEGKRGSIPNDLEPILTRLGINCDHWIEAATRFEKSFSSVAGNSSAIASAAQKSGKAWLKGTSAARRLFT
jgi:hypothetical protein